MCAGGLGADLQWRRRAASRPSSIFCGRPGAGAGFRGQRARRIFQPVAQGSGRCDGDWTGGTGRNAGRQAAGAVHHAAGEPGERVRSRLRPVIKKDAPAVDKEDAPRVAFWMAAPAAAPQVSHPAKPADAGAETGDGALGDLSLTAERAATPDPSGDAAAALVKVTPQSGAPLPVAIATPMSDGPDAPEDRASRDRKGAEFRTTPLNFAQPPAPVTRNGAPDSKLAAAEAAAEQVTAGGTAADADATFRQTAGDRQDRNEAAAGQGAGGSPAPGESAPDDPLRTKVGQTLSSVNPAISAVSSQLPTLGAPIGAGPSGRPVTEGLREGTIRRAQGPSGVAAKSQRVRDVMQAGTEVKLPRTAGARSVAKASPSAPQARSGGTKDRPGAAPEQEAVRGRSDGLRVSSTARMVPAQTQLPAAGLPAAERPAASPVLEEDRPPRPWREGRSPSPGATGKNRAPNAGTVGGRPLAAPAATGRQRHRANRMRIRRK